MFFKWYQVSQCVTGGLNRKINILYIFWKLQPNKSAFQHSRMLFLKLTQLKAIESFIYLSKLLSRNRAQVVHACMCWSHVAYACWWHAKVPCHVPVMVACEGFHATYVCWWHALVPCCVRVLVACDDPMILTRGIVNESHRLSYNM